MTRVGILLAALLGSAGEGAAGGRQDGKGAGATVGAGIAARVNDEVVTWRDVDERLKLPRSEITAAMRRAKLREIVEERLFLQWARRLQISVSDQEIEDQIKRETKLFPDEEQYEAWIRTRGLTKSENRERWRTTILVYKLHSYLIRKSWTNPDADTPTLLQDYVPPEEIRRYYDRHRDQFKAIEHVTVWRIGLQFSRPGEEAARRERAEALRRKIEKGTDFYVLAVLESDVWQTVENRETGETERIYGHRGLSREEAAKFYSPETVRLLFETLQEAETSDVVRDGRTFNIFRLVQRVSQKEETFEAAQPKIRSFLESQKREENRRRLRDELLKRALIVPPNLFDME